MSQLNPGNVVMIGGFLGIGTPSVLIEEIVRRGTGGLTLICNDTATPRQGVGKLISANLVDRVITCHMGSNPESQQKMNNGDMTVELIPQGTLVERIRSGGAGLGGVLTPTGLGTSVADGKQVIEVDGESYLLEKPMAADVALIAGFRGDRSGNLVYRGTARNLNPVMATAARIVIAAVDELYDIGDLDPDTVETPGIYVHMVVEA